MGDLLRLAQSTREKQAVFLLRDNLDDALYELRQILKKATRSND